MAQTNPATVSVAGGPGPWSSLLNTKFYIPQRINLVRRPRLTQQLQDGVLRRLVLISAPPGFGKTTLVSEWRTEPAAKDFPLAWLSLDAGDNDPVRFVTYLAGALQRLRPGVGESLPAMLYSPRPVPLAVALTSLVNDVTAIPHDFVLVLDDYHVIESQAVHNAMTFLIDHMPPQMHLVITTRVDPPLSLPLLRVRGELTEIRADELRFTAEEAADFLNQVMRLGLHAGDIEILEAQTEGWIAGLQLAALSLTRQSDVSSFVRTFAGSNRYLVDYLTEEVLSCQSDRLQEFLLQTSVLDRLTGALCDAVTGGSDGQHLLEQMEELNLFVVPLDEERRWYRYHQLFASFLRDRLQRLHPELLHELHCRACGWYIEANMWAEAVNHALAAEDWERAAGLIEGEVRRMVMRGEMRTLDCWLQSVPEAVLRVRPRLCLAHAWVLSVNSQRDEMELRLQDAEQGLAGLRSESERAAIRREIAAFRANLAADRGDLARTIEMSRLALQDVTEGDAYLQGLIELNLGFAYLMNGNMEESVQSLLKAHQTSRIAGNIQTALIAANELGRLLSVQMKFQQATELYRQSLDLATERGGRRLPVAGLAFGGLGEMLFVLNDLPAATEALEESIELSRKYGNFLAQLHGYLNLARVRRVQGNRKGMLAMLQQVWSLAEEHHLSPEVLGEIRRREVQLWILQGEIEPALRWAQENHLEPGNAFSVRNEYDYVVLAQSLVLAGRYQEAGGLVERLLNFARTMEWNGRIIQLRLLQAVVLENQGQAAAAWGCMQEALEMMSFEQPINLFLDEGATTRALLRRALERNCHSEYVTRLLAALEQPERGPAGAGGVSGFVPALEEGLSEALSERELEVLRLMADGKSNREMAGLLFLAEGTVKKHINNIYVKFDVHSRTQALARAREMGLL